MKLLLDQGTPRTAASILRKAGYDAVHTGEIGMAEAKDEDILARARQEGFTVVTLDADFHTHLALSAARKPSVVRIRIEGLDASRLATLVNSVIAHTRVELESGAMVSVQENRIRIRRLPLGAAAG